MAGCGGGDGIGHAQVFQVRHLTWTISTYYFPVSCAVVEGHCSRLVLKKDVEGEVEETWGEETAVVVKAAASIATESRTLRTDCVLRDSLEQRDSVRDLHAPVRIEKWLQRSRDFAHALCALFQAIL